jgi:hypothetical protein
VEKAFMYERIFSVVQDYPWKLLVGDASGNLDELARSEEPIRDSCTRKIRLPFSAGYNKEKLVEAISLLGEVPWSSVPVEQARASVAVLHRFHPGYSEEMLATRATLHQCRHLFVDPEAAKDERAQRRLRKLQSRNPDKTSGSHAFLSHLVRSAKEHLPSGTKLPAHIGPAASRIAQ